MGVSFEIKGPAGREVIPAGQVQRRLNGGCSFVSEDEQSRYEASLKETPVMEAEPASGDEFEIMDEDEALSHADD